MSGHVIPPAHRLILLLLAATACQDPNAPPVGMEPRSAQGALSTWTVTSPEDAVPGDGVCDDHCTLREAVNAAQSGDKIVFASGLNGTINLTESISIAEDLTVDGAGLITLNAPGNPAVTVSLANVELSGLTITGGTLGGVWNQQSGVLTLRSVEVTGNTSTIEGGGIRSNGDLVIINSSIGNNSSDGKGGGIWITGALTVVNSTIAGNTAAQEGGGIYMNGGTADIRGSTISGNISGSHAGAIYNHLGSMTVRSSALVKNQSQDFFGVEGFVVESATGQPASASFANTILGNIGSDCARFGGSTITSLGHNLSTGCFSSPSDVTIVPSQLHTEVLEEELEDNGGPTKTHALLSRGRAVDAGYCPGETTDQRGFPRPVDDLAMPNALDGCDIGPYELQGPVAVVADLMISQAVNKTSVKQGELLTYSIRVQNLGPETAPNVVVTDILPTGATFVEARHNKGSHTAPPSGETGTVTWSVGEMLDQANEVAEITVTVRVKGRTTITNTASVTGDVADPNEANNSAAIRVSVVSGTSGKGGSKK
jgi:uncharacterized repeat protein (TIGR01451 family)/CSLREA domain-containing protein